MTQYTYMLKYVCIIIFFLTYVAKIQRKENAPTFFYFP